MRAFVLTAMTPMLVATSVAAQASAPPVPLYTDLGAHHYEVTASDPLAQRYFDQGLRLYYAFNHAEAVRAFAEGARLDPGCAMCFWGVALAYGPNINAPMDSASGVAAYAALAQAKATATRVTPKEQRLIDALAVRYSATPAADRTAIDSSYSRAMARVASDFPDDFEVGTLYAESVMDLSPWSYWNVDGSPRPQTRELLAQLERVIAADPQHPGAHHFFIHAVEAVEPERAVPIAERLATMMPGAGHLVHMPGHIYVRVGRYVDAITANEHAVHADETFIRDQKPALGAYVAGYYPHNYDFLAFAASMVGRSAQAVSAAERLGPLAPAAMQREPGMMFLQHHATRHLQLKIRFARWDAILQTPAPDSQSTHAHAMWQYARGRALAATGRSDEARAALSAVQRAAADPAAAGLRLEFNHSAAVLGIAADVLAGHVAAADMNYAEAVSHLRNAVEREDALVYGEPPEWTVPVRQELGIVLLTAGLYPEAEQVFRDDLKRFPENGWSLHGLADALRAQQLTADADHVMIRFRNAWSSADFALGDRRASASTSRLP